MAFSLAEERETGHFDENGNFIEDKVRGGRTAVLA